MSRSRVALVVVASIALLAVLLVLLLPRCSDAPTDLTRPVPNPTSVTTPTPNATPTPAPTQGFPIPAPTQGFPIPEKEDLESPELGTALDDLVSRIESGEITEEEAAKEAPVSRGKLVAVTIHLSENVDGVVQFLADNDVMPRHVGEDYIEAFVPVRSLREISDMTGVLYVERIIPPQGSQQPPGQTIQGNGPEAHGSAAWNEAGFTGEGIKIGIIDAGFEGIGQLLGNELPETVNARCYGTETDDPGGLENCGWGDHGTLVAESIVDIAPEASLYLAAVWSKGDLAASVDWMISEGVSVINMSLGWTFDGPGDGTSPSSRSPLNTLTRAVDSGIVWINSAGNDADSAWFGAPSDSDGDGILEFSNFGEQLNLDTYGGPYLVQLRWDGLWGGQTSDLDLYVYDAGGRIVKRSLNPQKGGAGHNPYEVVRPAAGENTIIQVANRSATPPSWMQVVVWRGDIGESSQNGSITNPGESSHPGMLTVGAAHWQRTDTIEDYSSRGPAPDGRIKPDVVGADCGETALMGPDAPFCGTSQSSPHVAGMAALVRQRFPDFTPQKVVEYLKENAQERGSPGYDNSWGAGFSTLPPLSTPAPTATPPPTPAPTATPTPTPAPTATPPPTPAPTATPTPTPAPTATPTPTPAPNRDRRALEALYNATDGDNWEENGNWLSNAPLDQWYGVSTKDAGRVTGLDLRGNNLIGELPTELGYLSELEVLELWGNSIFGEIPSSLGDLSLLRVLDLGDNVLEGEIPEPLVNLDRLENLYLSGDFHDLTGCIPAGLSDVPNNDLDLLGLPYCGAVAQLSQSPDRAALVALYNATDGANWTNNTNWLSDEPLGAWHGVTTDANGRVTELVLTWNQLSGSIPVELGSLSNLQELYLYYNQLSGSIPAELGSLANLRELDLSNNQLSGSIPTELGNLVNLEGLSLNHNELSGSIPEELGSLANLTLLWLYANQLSGSIPEELSILANLETLILNSNQLSGTIPTELGSLSNLTGLYLWGNQLSGSIPEELGSLANLESLNLSSNQLSGSIPEELGSLSNLEWLYLDNNQLSGSIPEELGSLSNLEILRLAINQLSGSIPEELGSLSNLEWLYLYNNQLSGSIPEELGSLSNLEILWLGNNQLTGPLPQSFTNLTALEQFRIADNAGLCVPTDTTFQNWLQGIPSRDNGSNCSASALGAPTIGAVTPGTGSLAVSWTAPSSDGGSAITAYDLRHIETSADEAVDSNWTVVDDVWTTGGGTLQYTLTGLTGGTQYDIQVRAVNAGGDGPWSATATGTPTAASADRIAFSSHRDGNREIYVMNADGSGVTRLTNNSAEDGSPAWSPDGRRIAFYSLRDGNYEIYVMNADGSGVTRLTNNSADDVTPAWSPDGRRIAFTSLRDGNYEIYVMNADGSGQSRLTSNSAAAVYPAWSPDGRRIAFYSLRDGNYEIYVMNADGSSVTRLTNNSAGDFNPDWSPDGNRIAFDSSRDGNREIYVMNADGSGVTRLTNNSVVDYDPAWSPAADLTDREILVALYNATDGANWTDNTNWLSDEPLGDWHGVTTDADGRVTELSLSRNSLAGTIPSELGSLSSLTSLSLGRNNLTGAIPAELGNLSNLETLWLGDNQLTGAIPAELGSLSILNYLGLESNALTGPVPTELGDLTILTWLALNSNQLTGSLPQSFTNLTQLPDFAFSDNAGLCAPTDAGFQTWLQGISNSNMVIEVAVPFGPNCADPSTGSTDYDADDDGLIEVGSLAQLNAIRWDLDGDGTPASVNASDYSSAYPNAAAGMNCPSTGCIGYELTANLDFDTNGNGRADAGDSYWNDGAGWEPITDSARSGYQDATFHATFEGNSHVISGLYINRSGGNVGLFGIVWGGEIRNLGLEGVAVSGGGFTGGLVGIAYSSPSSVISASYVTGAVSGSGVDSVGGLVGFNQATITASYAAVSVSGTLNVGGLVGTNHSSTGSISASYATGSVTGRSQVGGIVGNNQGGSITATYATGPVSGTGLLIGGLVGDNDRGNVSASYWDTQTSGQSTSAGGEGKTTSELQSPTSNTGIYATWDINVWDFGTSSQYPALKGLAIGVAEQRRSHPAGAPPTDYDTDDDGLIEVGRLAQLNAIRWDLDGNGTPTSANASDYYSAFPNAPAGMGCPSTGCTGYELTANLDFDTNGSGDANSGDTYWNGGSGWDPIVDGARSGHQDATFHATFEGNSHVISGLYIDRSGRNIGLFGSVWGGEIRNLGLEGVVVKGGASNVGGLVGSIRGGSSHDSLISGSYVTGTVTGSTGVGGLAGFSSNEASINASYAAVSVSGNVNVGGLVGTNHSSASISASYAMGSVTGGAGYGGGLVGSNQGGSITASYAANSLSGQFMGGLVGDDSGGTVTASYWDTGTSGQTTSAGGEGKTTSELQSPTSNTGIYATWDSYVWDFGTTSEYPNLKGVGS